MVELENLLEMVDISKGFPGVKALSNVSFTCIQGEVHALVGENGAGKSTLMKILAGAQQPDSGKIYFKGKLVHLQDPIKAQKNGISIIYQELNLLPYLSIAENITLGHEPHGRSGLIDIQERNRLAKTALDELGADLDVNDLVYQLSVAQQQLVEIAKAISQKAEFIIMDEPTAALSDSEVKRLFEVINSLRSGGITIVYVSHRMEEIFEIADRVTVLKDGENVGTLLISETNEAQIIKMMVGRELKQLYPFREEVNHREVLLDVNNLSVEDQVDGVSFKLHKGEIIGVSGLVGSGRTALARGLFGAAKITGGELRLHGKRYLPSSPADSIQSGFGFMTDDRKEEGLVLGLSIRENIALPSLGERQRLGFLNRNLEGGVVNRTVQELQIQTTNIEKSVQYLSGGNQQKVVLGKWLSLQSTPDQLCGPEIILFDEPTRGIDIGAKTEIYNLMRRLADQGKTILMLSSELPEIIGMSDRILVMRDGRLAADLKNQDVSQEDILTLAAGAASSSRRNNTKSSSVLKLARKTKLQSWLFENQSYILIYGVLIALLIFGFTASESFRSPANLFSLLRQSVALGLVSIGQTFIVLAGGIDLSVSAVITLTALFGAGLMDGRVEMILPVVLLCLGIGVLFGLINGTLWARLGVEPFIVTLGLFSIGRGIALVYARGPVGWVPPIYQQFAYADIGPVPVAVIFFAFALVASFLVLRFTRLGRQIFAVGGNPEAARLSGVPVNKVRITAFILSGVFAAITGLYMASRMGSGDPNIGPGFEFDSITAVVVGGTLLGGGRGSLIGTLGGVLLVATLSNLLNMMNIDNWYQQVFKGLILLIAVAAYRKRGKEK